MNVKVKKVWMGHVSVRDYIVDQCLDRKEDLTVEFDGTHKTYPFTSLNNHLANCSKNTFISKYDGKKYTLIDFPWI